MMYVPWSYDYSKSLSAISERLGGGCQCANLNVLQKGNQYWVSIERARNEPKRSKNCVFGPKDVCFFFLQKEPGSAATVLPLIVQPGLVPSPSERRLSMPYIKWHWLLISRISS